MNAAHYPSDSSSAVPLAPDSLRTVLRRRAELGQVLPLDSAIAQLLPLCVEVAELNSQGYGCYLHPSSVLETKGGVLALDRERAVQLPQSAEDRACLPPETRPDQLNDAPACVYSLGAILYELVTGRSAGPGMLPPSHVNASLPKELDAILRAALITDPRCRPDDLTQLAESLHQLARPGTVPPPSFSAPVSFRPSQISIDLSLSLIPPDPAAPAPIGPLNSYGVAIAAVNPVIKEAPVRGVPTLAERKAELDKDPRPRFFVVKDNMDHGPFTAGELAQQILAEGFSAEDSVVDNVSGTRGPLEQFPQFGPFAEQARKTRAHRDRQDAIVQVAARDKKSTRGKTMAGLAVLVAMLASGSVWYLSSRGQREDEVAIAADRVSSVETEGSLAVKKRRRARRQKRSSQSSSGIPQISGGKSCEAARDEYVEVKDMDGPSGPNDLTSENYAPVLNSGRYFSHCRVPNSMAVNICAAVQNGRAVGVTVTTKPANAAKRRCITKAVRKLHFPSHPKLDVTRTSFAAQ